jgi:hypothetical protein
VTSHTHLPLSMRAARQTIVTVRVSGRGSLVPMGGAGQRRIKIRAHGGSSGWR